MYFNVAYEFHNGKQGTVPFFHLSKLLRWHELMKEQLASVVVSIYVQNELHEKFVWNE